MIRALTEADLDRAIELSPTYAQALLNRSAPLLCQSCHSQRGHPSISFTEESLPGGNPSAMVLGRSCANCHTQVHGSNHPSGFSLMR